MPGEFRTRELIGDQYVVTHTIDDSHDGWRADQYLQTQYKSFSRNKLQNLIAEGRVVMDSKRVKPSTTLRMGDRIKVISEKMEEPEVDIDYGILYEDKYILVIDKPANLPVHPAGKFLFNTLLMHLRKERGHNFNLIHRLDRETSGVLLLAKDGETAGHLVRQFRERQTSKSYWAVCLGHPEEDRFSVDADIGSAVNSYIRLKMQAFPKGTGEMDALTHFEVLKRASSGLSLVNCDLMTGRQHQIRVHLHYAGFPVVGDKLYGADDSIFIDHIARKPLSEEAKRKLVISRHALHSRYLKFYHDRIGKWVEVESPLPQDMKDLIS